MKLEENWLTNGLIDFEYKKYVMLAYMQKIMSHFEEKKLYPFLSELVFHYNNLLELKKNKSLLYENFPKRISKADFEKLKISYDRIIKDDSIMSELEEVIHFSIPYFKEGLDKGAELYEEIANNIKIEPIGIAPLFNKEGYLFLCEPSTKETHIFRFKIKTISLSNEAYHSISTEFVANKKRDLTTTLESIKIGLINTYKAMPNPATFAAFAYMSYPVAETLLPITKRKLVRQIGKAA